MTDAVLEQVIAEIDTSAAAPGDHFAYVPAGEPPSGRKLPIGDAEHARLAVEAVTTGLEGHTVHGIPADKLGAVKSRIAAAIHRFYSGAEQDYYLKWLHSSKKPDDKPVKEIRLSTPSFAFRGSFPDVPLAQGVDYEALTAGDPGLPLFVVRPLAVLGAVSDNGLKYDQNLLSEICQQVNTKKPAARQGHVSEEASSYAFPPDVGLWVGAAQVGDTLYGKAYIYPGTPFHQMVIKRKAAGSTLSNSIWGKGHFETNKDGTQKLSGLDLESIDFAPAERAALEALGGQFETTSEMKDRAASLAVSEVTEMADKHDDRTEDLALIRDEIAKHVKETAPAMLHEMMTKEQRQHCAEMHVREMEPSAVYEMLPSDHKKVCAECYVKEFGQKMPAAEMAQHTQQLAEMQRQLTEDKTTIAEMQRTIAEFKQKEFDTVISAATDKPFASYHITQPQWQDALTSLKSTYKLHIVAQMGGSSKLEDIQPAADRAWVQVEPQARLLVTAASGGNVIAGLQGTVSEQRQAGYGWDPKTGRYNDDVAKQARAAVMGG